MYLFQYKYIYEIQKKSNTKIYIPIQKSLARYKHLNPDITIFRRNTKTKNRPARACTYLPVACRERNSGHAKGNIQQRIAWKSDALLGFMCIYVIQWRKKKCRCAPPISAHIRHISANSKLMGTFTVCRMNLEIMRQ